MISFCEIVAGGEEDRRRKFGQDVVGQVEVEVVAGQVAALRSFLLLDFLDLELGKEHAALVMVGVRQRQKASGKHALFPDLFGAHGGQLVDVVAGREGGVARPGEHQAADGGVGLQRRQLGVEDPLQPGVEGVVGFRPVEGDERHPRGGPVHEDGGLLHGLPA